MNGFRPPNYSPGYNKALMDDPMALTFMMFGAPMLQQAAGAQNFVPHLTPSQALSDQFLASRYQRDQLQSVNAASERGNTAVAARFLGLRAMVTDAPATQLNREQANMFASAVNNPIAKAALASVVGPENLEAVMFGRKGDPSALANASNKINFFRRDTTGGARMSGQSMEEFSQNLYENLYGSSADVDDMHGFMAGQTGSVVENLFQRGQLPKSMGEMSAAERVKLMSSSQRDDATMDRLARQFGHSEMMKQESYASATAEERKGMLDKNLDTYKGRLQNTFQEIDRFNSGDPRAKGAGEIEKMDGYGMAARNVDSQRVAKVAKEYTGALDAIRDIFGDNGNGNAPVEALMQALDEFSAGSIDRIDPKKVEKTMRDMRGAMQAGGVNLEAFAQITAQGTGLAQMYGTPADQQMAANAQTVQQLAAMQQTGKFSRKLYGEMTEGEAIQETQSRIYRGQQSESGKSMSTLNRMYQQNKEMYAGTELEAAMKAYNDPGSDGMYTYNGERRNIAEATATRGRGGALDILRNSGGNAQTFDAFYYDPATAEKYSSGLELTAQRKEMTRDLSNRVIQGALAGRMRGERFEQVRSRGFMGMGGQSEEEFERERNDMAKTLSRGFAQVIMDETGGMTSEERAEHLEKRHVDMIAQYYESRGYNKRNARSRAESASRAMFGETEGQRREALSGIAAESNTYVNSQTGHQIVAEDQISGADVQQRTNENEVRFAAQAEGEKRVARGQKSSLLQRSGEVLEKMGNDPNYSGKQAAMDLLNAQDIEQMRERYTDGGASSVDPAAAGFDSAGDAVSRAAATDQLNTVGAAGETADAINQATVFNRADRLIDEDVGAAFRAARAADEEGPRVDGAIDTAMTAVNVATSAAGLYGSASDGLAALSGEGASDGLAALSDEDVNKGQAAAKAARSVLDATDTAATVASGASKFLNGSSRAASLLSRSSTAAGFGAKLGSASKVLAPVSKVAPWLSPLLGGAAGAFEGAENGRGALEGGILGTLTGDASSGSMMSGMLGIEQGSTADKALGVVGATGGGAMQGAALGGTIGAFFGGVGAIPGAAIGAVAGGVLGLGAEAYKLFTDEDPAATAATQAVEQTVNASQTDRSPPRQTSVQAADPGGDGNNEITVSGTLSLRGLNEVLLQATGNRPMETPGGGVPVLGT